MRLQQEAYLKICLPCLSILMVTLACSRSDVPVVTDVAAGMTSPIAIAPTNLPAETIATVGGMQEQTAEPTGQVVPVIPVTPTFPPTPELVETQFSESLIYTSQPGDTLRAIAVRFGVIPTDIQSMDGQLDEVNRLLDPGLLLVIPRRISESGPSERLIPDSEIVYSPHAADFDTIAFAAEQNGFLNEYREILGGRWRSGAEVVEIAARDNSINPRLLLALIEYHAGWVTRSQRPPEDIFNFPLGIEEDEHRGLYRQLTWAANEIGNGYYSWRSGSILDVRLNDGIYVRFAPQLNAGTVALQYYFARQFGTRMWEAALDQNGFIAVYGSMFGNPWAYEHPLYEPGVHQPDMILPFLPGRVWAYTGGPHGAWEREAAWAAIDFAPSMSLSGCAVSDDWVVAVAAGLVVRSENGVVMLDLDGDGREQTGWNMLYLHIATDGRVAEGTFLEQGDRIGHPSCEGGRATGTHVHMARKYNGEWILADGPLPFELSGWVVQAGTEAYQGALFKDDQIVLACDCATQETLISR